MSIARIIISDQNGILDVIDAMSRVGKNYYTSNDDVFTQDNGIILPSVLPKNTKGFKQRQYLIDIVTGLRLVNIKQYHQDVRDLVQMYLIEQQMMDELGITSGIIVHPTEFIKLLSVCCIKLGFSKTGYYLNGDKIPFFDNLPEVFGKIFLNNLDYLSPIVKGWMFGHFNLEYFKTEVSNNLSKYGFNILFASDYGFTNSFYWDLIEQIKLQTNNNVSFDDVFSSNNFQSSYYAQQLVISGLNEATVSPEQLKLILENCGISMSICDMIPGYLNGIFKYLNN